MSSIIKQAPVDAEAKSLEATRRAASGGAPQSPDPAHDTSRTLAAIRKVVPEISKRADEIEQQCRVPPEIMDKLRDAGLFRMMIPRQYGGDELHSLQVSRVLEALAEADGSVAWIGMVAVGFNKFIAHYPRKTLDAIFADSADVYMRGAIAPKGVLTPAEGG